MAQTDIDEVMEEINEWSVEDLRELADRCLSLADAVEDDEKKKDG